MLLSSVIALAILAPLLLVCRNYKRWLHGGGQKKLRAYLTERGVDPDSLPESFIAECEKEGYELARFTSKYGKKFFPTEYETSLQGLASHVADILHEGTNGGPPADHPLMRKLMQDHGVLPRNEEGDKTAGMTHAAPLEQKSPDA